MPTDILTPLCQFAATVTDRLKPGTGEPEDQLRGPLENFLSEAGEAFGMKVQALGEVHVEDIGRPDYAVFCNDALSGYLELKQAGKGGDPRRARPSPPSRAPDHRGVRLLRAAGLSSDSV